jgi:hypothetical protein
MSIPATRLRNCSNKVRRMWRLMDAGVAAVVALVVTESLRSVIASL